VEVTHLIGILGIFEECNWKYTSSWEGKTSAYEKNSVCNSTILGFVFNFVFHLLEEKGRIKTKNERKLRYLFIQYNGYCLTIILKIHHHCWCFPISVHPTEIMKNALHLALESIVFWLDFFWLSRVSMQLMLRHEPTYRSNYYASHYDGWF